MIIYCYANCHGFVSFLIITSSSEVGVGNDREQMVSFSQGWYMVRWAWQKVQVVMPEWFN